MTDDTGLRPTRAVWIATFIYAGLMTALGIDRYVTYHSGEDLGVFTQSIADALGGMRNQVEGGSHFAIHFSPLLYLCAPALLVAHSPVALIAIQAWAGALTAVPIYLIARRRMDAELSSKVAIVALLYPPLVGVTFTDFHENGFAPAAVAWLLWAVDARRWGLAALFAATTLGIKEDEAYVLAVLGAGYAMWSLSRKDRVAAVFGTAVASVSTLAFIGFFTVIRPMAGATGEWHVLGYYSPGAFDAAHGWAAVSGRVTYLLEALGPLLFLPAFSPWFALAIPGLIEVLASRWTITYTMGQHYAGVWIGYVLAAFVFALASIAGKDRAKANRLANFCTAVCILIFIFASPTHWGHFLSIRTPHDEALDRTLARIPSGASAGSVDEVFVHMSLNPNARSGYSGNLTYLVVDNHYDSPSWRGFYRAQLREQLASGLYRPVASDDGITLFERSSAQP